MNTTTHTQTRGAITPTRSYLDAVARREPAAAVVQPLVSATTRKVLGLDQVPEPVLTPGQCSVCGTPRIEQCLDASGRCEVCMP